MASWLQENAIALVGLLATLGLLGVTFWYARITKDMAGSAKVAAEESARATAAAERSAQAALDATLVAQARANVEFSGRTVNLKSRDGDHRTVELMSDGDAVVVQCVRARRAFRVKDDGSTHEKPCIEDEPLTPVGEVSLPTRLHRGERIYLTHTAMNVLGEDPVRRLLLEIDYTFSESGSAGGTRKLLVTPNDQ
jgi:hypothetical protein